MNQDDRRRLRSQLIRHEGIRLFPYYCPAQQLTIGVGRNLEAKGISENEALFMLDNDLNEAMRDLRDLLPPWDLLSPARQAVLIDMRHQLGLAGFRGFKRMIGAILLDKIEVAGHEITNSVYGKQVPVRAENLKKQWLTGVWNE